MPEIVFRNIEDTHTKDGTVDYQNNPADKKNTGTWKACPYILGNECCERLAFYGVMRNLFPYFSTRLHQHRATAYKNALNWSRTCFLTPFIGAFFADAYLGRYWIIFIFSIIYFLGMSLLTISTTVPGFKPSCKQKDDCKATNADLEITYVALYLVALGTGGIKSCVAPYGADQFDDTDEVENKQKSSYFNWFYFWISMGALLTTSVLVVIQDRVSWGWKFGLPAVVMTITIGAFYTGTYLYRNQKPSGSPFTRFLQVIVASWRKRGAHLPIDKSNLYETTDTKSSIVGSRKIEHTKNFSFLDKAAVELQSDNVKTSVDPWRLCTVTQVEEFKSIIKLLPIWATIIIFCTVYSQMSDLFILQGSKMDLTFIKYEIKPESLIIFDILSVLFWVPVYDMVFVPYTRKYTGHEAGITQLQRIGIGLLISIYAMLSAGVLEIFRLRIIRKNNYYDLENIPMSVFWQGPQYFFIGCAEVFTIIGQIEFFYDQAPDSMRSLCNALSLSTFSLGSYLSSLIVTIVRDITTKGGKLGWIPEDNNLNRGSLQNFFWLLTFLSLLNLGAYLLVARWYTYKRAVGTLH